jgi:hypothetical protein
VLHGTKLELIAARLKNYERLIGCTIVKYILILDDNEEDIELPEECIIKSDAVHIHHKEGSAILKKSYTKIQKPSG